MAAPGSPAVPVVLASASVARRRMLHQAGLTLVADPADIDEESLKVEAARQGKTPVAIALALAEAKAVAVSLRHPDALVIGADQVLVCGGRLLSKAADRQQAAATLERLRGRSHRLVSAVALVRDGRISWRHVDTARLRMRAFSKSFLQSYLAAEGKAVIQTVGAYALEGRGAQLFDRVDGDHFTVLGLPLLPLLAQLRREGVIAT
ncbi:MAG: septum formation protein Maf [Rhodospirillales bacterium]|nr:MAG: septum formation protein Maf [Rhodospirillales bacterium]